VGFSLKDKLNEAIHQVNPFDNGQTAATVRRQASVAPAQTMHVQPAAPKPNPVVSGLGRVASFGSRLVDQVNPFDNNRTFKQHDATNDRSVVGQATHNAVSNVVGGGVKFVPQFAENYSNTFANLGRRAAGKKNATIEENMGGNPLLDNALKLSGATGTNKQLAAGAAEIALSTLPGAGKGASLVTKAAIDSGIGAGFGAAGAAGDGGSIRDVLESAAIGGVTGGAIPIAARGVQRGVKATKEIATNKPHRHISDEELTAANRVSMTRSGFPDNMKPGDLDTYRAVQKKLGVDINDHDAIDHMIGARMTYDTRMSQRPKFLSTEGGGYGTQYHGKGKKPHEQFVDEYASALEHMDSGMTGGQMIPDGEGGYTRMSEHTPFYRNFYRDNGRAPGKRDYARESQRQLDSGKADSYAQEEYNQLRQSTEKPALDRSVAADDMTPIDAALAQKQAKLKERVPTEAVPPSVIQTPEGLVSVPVPGDIPTTNAGKVKPTRFTDKTVQNSDQVSAEVKGQTDASYTADTMKGAQARAEQHIADNGHDSSLNQTISELGAKRGSASRDTLARAIELAARHDAAGTPADQAMAAQLYQLVGEHGSASGQQAQILAAIARRSPAGLRNKAFSDLKKNDIDVLKTNEREVNQLLEQQKGQMPGSPEYIATNDKIAKLVDKDAKNKSIRDEIQGHIDAISQLEDGPVKDYAIAALQKAVGKHLPQKKSDQLISLWKAGLLSGVRTHGGNVLSNATFGALKKISDPLSAAADTVMSLRPGGKRTKTATGRGLASGAKEGAVNGLDTLKTGIDRRNIGDKFEQHAELNFNNPLIQKTFGNAANGVFRLLSASDQPPYYAALKNSLYDQAKADGLNRNLSGRALGRHMDELVKNPTENMVMAAERDANKAVLSYDTFGSKAIAGIHRGIDNLEGGTEAGKTIAHAAVNILAPFVRVPTAFISRTVDFTPLGISKEIFHQVASKKFSQRDLATAIGESATGTGVIALGIALSQNKLLSGDFPKNDRKEQARWKAEGITPNSVKIGNKWVSLNYLGPVGLLFNAGHKMESAKGESAGTKIGQAVAGLGQGLLGQSFLQGFSGFSDAIQDPERNAKSFINSQASSVIPSLSNDVATATDSKQRQADTVAEAVKNRIPGARETNKVKTDVYGNELKRQSNALDTINPFRPSTNLSTPVTKEVSRLHNIDPENTDLQVTPTPVGRTVTVDKKTVDLNNDQKYKLGNAIGKATNDAWQSAMKSDVYKGLDDTGKAKMLSNIRSDAKTLAERQFVVDNNLGTYSKPVTNRQAALSTGDVDLTDYVSSAQGGASSSVKGDSRGTALLAHINSLSTSQRAEWSNKPLDGKYKDLYERSKGLSPAGLPELPKTNGTLTAYATYLKAKEKNPTDLEMNRVKKTFLKDAYSSGLTKNSKDLLGSYSTADKVSAVTSGSIPRKEVEAAIAYDDMLLKTGLATSPSISNKVRESIGVSAAPASKGGSGPKAKTYALYSGSANPIKGSAQLRDLAKAAMQKLPSARVAGAKKARKVRAPKAVKAVKTRKVA
jgi:hypothetical protein